MMYEEIETAVKEQCRTCERRAECDVPACLARRIKKILTYNDEKIARINIDDFFDEQINGQMTMF